MSAAIAEPDKQATKEEEKSGSSNTLNSPNISPATGKPTARAISNAKQAWGIAKSLRDRAIDNRLRTAAFIGRAYNGDSPFFTKDLERTGQGWRNNFSTNPLASVIDRVTPQIVAPLKAAPVLVTKQLPSDWKDGANKARKFNETTSKVIRAWPEWNDTLSGLAQEVVIYGNAVVTRLGDDWRPRMWRYDEVYLPEGSGQHASKLQVFAIRQTYLMHEFLDLIRDKALAEKAGYNYEGCVKVANTAGGFKGGEETPTEQQDAIREQSPIGFSYAQENATKVVRAFHVIVRDYTGEIDVWTVSEDDGTEIRSVKGAHEEMKSCTSLYTMQAGNRKFYGSKGLGRLLTNLHTAIDRNRNYTADKINFSGYPVIKSEDPASMQLQLRYPFMVAPVDAQILVETFQVNWEASEGLDNKLVGIMESIAGAFIPPNIDNSGSSKTKIEAAQKAERDIAVREGVLSRFANQSRELIDMMVRGMFSPVVLREGKRAYEEKKRKTESKIIVVMRAAWRLLKKAFGKTDGVEPVMEATVADEVAVQAVVDLLEAGLTMEEIAILAVTPNSASNEDEGAQKDAATIQYIAANRTNPRVDQQKATEMEAHIVLGETRAQELVIPGDDHNVRDAAIRWQTIEIGEMLDGRAMPVVGSDNHAVHRQTLAPQLDALMELLTTAPTPEIVGGVKLMLQHYDQHIQQDPVMTENAEGKSTEEGAIRGMWQTVTKVEQALAAATAEQMATGGPGAPGNPPAASPEAAQTENEQLENAARLSLETKKVSQRDRELTMQEDELAHKKEFDAATLQQKTIQIAADITAKERQAEQAAADRELAAAAKKGAE